MRKYQKKKLPTCEPSTRIVKLRSAFANRSEIYAEDVEFFVVLCGDVLLELMQYGDRRQLIKSERIGGRFHRLIETYFGKKPFLRMELHLSFVHVNTLIAKLDRRKLIANPNFVSLPQFIRFSDVNLCYRNGLMEGAIKCKRFIEHLKSLKSALNDLKLLHFDAEINQLYGPDFSSRSNLLHHLRDELLPVCESSRAYKFTIRFRGWETNTTAFIESLLQIPQNGRCPDVGIKLSNHYNVQLPVEAIAQWLHQQSSDTNRISDPKRREKFLTIELNDINIPNLLEISSHLTKAFNEADAPTTPFTLLLKQDFGYGLYAAIEDQKHMNRKTNEEFSLQRQGKYGSGGLKIKRAAKEIRK